MKKACVAVLWQMPNYSKVCVSLLWQFWLSQQDGGHSSELKNLSFFVFKKMSNGSVPVLWQMPNYWKVCVSLLWQSWLSQVDIPVSWKTTVSLYLKKCQMLLCQCCGKCHITLVSKSLCAGIVTTLTLYTTTFLWAQNLGIPSAGISAAVTGEKCVYGGSTEFNNVHFRVGGEREKGGQTEKGEGHLERGGNR
jgi:hypothetical protein